MKSTLIVKIIVGFVLSTSFKVYAQDYFKIFNDSIDYAETKIKRFPNGDIVLATSSLESLRNGGKDGRVFCQRLDYCGQILWSFGYQINEDHIILNDISILQSGEIVLFGSIYKGLKESIFLMKINGQSGLNEEIKIFNPGTVDHFTYSIDIKDDIVLLYGLLLDFNTKKHGFIAQFNGKLHFQWAKKFFPFESSGRAILTKENSILCFSGNYIFHLNEKGNTKWAFEIKGDNRFKIIGGPTLTSVGAIFEGNISNKHALFKINRIGEMEWVSKTFNGNGLPSAINVLADGTIHISYINKYMNNNLLGQISFSKEGQIAINRSILLPKSLNSYLINQQIDAQLNNTLFGSNEPFSIKKGEINSFILQHSISEELNVCLEEINIENFEAINTPLILEPIQPTISSFNIVLESAYIPDTTKWNRSFDSPCLNNNLSIPLEIDTTLGCDESWKISLPNQTYIWSDNYPQSERIVKSPGIYKAYKLDCSDPSIHLFTLKKENCDCPIYIPNVFSPNNDGINDQLDIFVGCELVEYHWKIYSRWGDLLENGNGGGWTGAKNGRPLPPGTYLISVDYKVKDLNGEIKDGNKSQLFQLMR